MKITLTNFFEEFKTHIPMLPSSEKYGEWFAQYSKNFDAKTIARFHKMHVEQIINTHNQVDKKMFESMAGKAIRKTPSKDEWSGACYTENDWKKVLVETMQKMNAWDQMDSYNTSNIHARLERQRFFNGFYNTIKDQPINTQHLWLFDVAAEECQTSATRMQKIKSDDLPAVASYPLSNSARNQILKNICNIIWETHNTQLLKDVIGAKIAPMSTVGDILFNRGGKWKNVPAKSHLIEEAMRLGMEIPMQVIPSLIQSDPNTTDLIWTVLQAASSKDAQEMTKALLPNVLHNISFATQLLNDPKCTPNCLETISSFVDTSPFLSLWRCISDEQKDTFLSPVCAQYLKKNKDPSLKKISEFVHGVSETFPSSEQKMVVLRMFAVLVGAKHQELGALLSSSVLEQASLQQRQATIKRKM